MSRKEEQRRIREEKKQAARRREKYGSALFKVAAAIVVVLALYVFLQGLFGGAPVYPPDQVAETDHVRGAEDAPVTLTMYADFQCPACAREARLIEQAWPRISDNVRLVFRHFPLDTHRHSFLAARYAEAAGLQGSFWEMHDQLFNNQQSWAVLNDVEEVFNSYARQIGLDLEQLQEDLGRSEVRDKIIADQQSGVRAGVRGTPSLFINGELVSNPATPGRLIEMIEQRLDGAGA